MHSGGKKQCKFKIITKGRHEEVTVKVEFVCELERHLQNFSTNALIISVINSFKFFLFF